MEHSLIALMFFILCNCYIIFSTLFINNCVIVNILYLPCNWDVPVGFFSLSAVLGKSAGDFSALLVLVLTRGPTAWQIPNYRYVIKKWLRRITTAKLLEKIILASFQLPCEIRTTCSIPFLWPSDVLLSITHPSIHRTHCCLVSEAS